MCGDHHLGSRYDSFAFAILDCAHVSDALSLYSVTDLVEMASKLGKLFASQFAPARAPVIATATVNCALKGKERATYEIVSDLKLRRCSNIGVYG